MEFAIKVGGEAEMARLDPRERREHNAMSDWSIDRVMFAIPRCVIGVYSIEYRIHLEARGILYSFDVYR